MPMGGRLVCIIFINFADVMSCPAKFWIRLATVFVCILILTGCRSTKHVPDGEYLLDKISIKVEGNNVYGSEELRNFLKQQPNHKMLWLTKTRLGIYNLSGTDTSKWYNRRLRSLGEAPVIYDSLLTLESRDQLRQAFFNKGFLNAEAFADTVITGDKKMAVNYTVVTGEPHIIKEIERIYPDDEISEVLRRDSMRSAIRVGDKLDVSLLEAERERLTTMLRNRGYYTFNKELITFNADTTAGSMDVELTMTVSQPEGGNVKGEEIPEKYVVRNVVFITDFDAGMSFGTGNVQVQDTVFYKNIEILYGEKQYLRPSVLWENNFIIPGRPYREIDVQRTYNALSRFEILKFIDIRFVPKGTIDGEGILDAYILLTPTKSQSVAVEVEGTNSEGDLGVALGVSYSHSNIGKGSEAFTAKVRGAYESLSGNLDGLINDRYMEYSLDMRLSFPKFKAPFLRETFKRRVNATTDLSMSINYQERPEYTRIISTVGWNYRFTERLNRNRHILTPIDINYVYLPKSTYDFIDQIAPDNPLLRYSYEDHFIMRLGYAFYHTNKRNALPWQRGYQKNIYTIRANAEIAGNLLFALSNIFQPHRDFRENPYRVFGIPYSQYFKVEGEYTLLHIFNHRNSVAFQAMMGVGYPYGNSTILPFEKRFYGGGANGVRGWSVRTLGPGAFPGTNSVSDFLEQCGDIRFKMSAEYRAKLFWVVELGAFIDVGNIWTIKNYENQPGGLFKFNEFYKQLAAAYGLGLRLDFNYFLLRFDLGMKAHNPAMGQEPWPLIHPRWRRDHAFHFSIGYPF